MSLTACLPKKGAKNKPVHVLIPCSLDEFSRFSLSKPFKLAQVIGKFVMNHSVAL